MSNVSMKDSSLVLCRMNSSESVPRVRSRRRFLSFSRCYFAPRLSCNGSDRYVKKVVVTVPRSGIRSEEPQSGLSIAPHTESDSRSRNDMTFDTVSH